MAGEPKTVTFFAALEAKGADRKTVRADMR